MLPKITYESSCKANDEYPKVVFVCGEVHRIDGPEDVPVVYVDDHWEEEDLLNTTCFNY